MNCSLSKYSIIIILLLASAQKVSHFSFSIRVGLDLVEGRDEAGCRSYLVLAAKCRLTCTKIAGNEEEERLQKGASSFHHTGLLEVS